MIVYLNVNSLNKISLKRKLGGGGGGGGGGRNLDDVYCLLPDFIRVQLLNSTPIGELCRLNYVNYRFRALDIRNRRSVPYSCKMFRCLLSYDWSCAHSYRC